MMKFKRGGKGFTLIELMIVVAIIGILAAVAIPRFAQMLERAREGATKGNAAAIRGAITVYYGQNEGTWPADIGAAAFSTYISPLPPAKATPLGNVNTVTFLTGVPGASGTGWAYVSDTTDSDVGTVWCNSNQTDSRGTNFSTY